MKRIFVLIVVFCLFGKLFSLEWVMSNHNTTLTISGEGAMPDFESKDVSGGKDVPWNQFSEIIDTIVIREGITSIGANAFAYLFNLKRVYFPESLEVIGYGAFDWCPKLKDLTFPEGLKRIEDKAFIYSDLVGEVVVPAGTEFNAETVFSAKTKIDIGKKAVEKTSGSF